MVSGRISSPSLVGRRREFDALDGAARSAVAGRPSLCLIAGEGGIGKTRLTCEFEALASDAGVLCLRGNCLALAGGEVPFAPFVGVFRDAAKGPLVDVIAGMSEQARGRLADLFPAVFGGSGDRGAVQAGVHQAHIHEDLLGVLGDLASAVPVALVLEDLHWADESTRDFVHYLARNLTTQRLAAVTTYRSDELDVEHPVRALVAELVRCASVWSLELQRLTLDETREQIAGIMEQPPDEASVVNIHRRSEGNPFFVEELLAARASGDPQAIPATLRDVLLARVRMLPAETQGVLRLLAAFGRPVRYRLLAAAMRPPIPGAARDAVRHAIDQHVLVPSPDGDRITFRHALVREALYADLVPGEREELHDAIAGVLAEADPKGAVAEVAYHHLVAGNVRPALVWSIEAGLKSAAGHAYPEALGQFSRALDLWHQVASAEESTSLDLFDVYAHAADAARLTGEYERAIDLCHDALSRIDPVDDPVRSAQFYERLSRYESWDVEKSLGLSSRALARLPAAASPGRARLMTAEARALGLQGRWPEARRRAQEALEVALAAGAGPEEGSARTELGLALAFLGDCDAAEDQLREARSTAERLGRPEELAYAWVQTAELERIRGRVGDALTAMRQGQAEAARTGASASWGDFMAVVAGNDLFWLGRWTELDRLLDETVEANAGRPGAVTWPLNAGRLAMARGKLNQARSLLEQSWTAALRGVTPELLPHVSAALGEVHLWMGRHDDARERILEGRRLIADHEDPLNMPVLYATGVRVEADAAAHARIAGRARNAEIAWRGAEEFGDLIDALLAPQRGWAPPATARAYLDQTRAELSAMRKEALAATLWERVARAWDELAHPYLAAYGRYRHADALLARRGGRARAAAALRVADAGAGNLGARLLQREIESLARRARLDLERAGPHVPAVGPDDAMTALGLTRREVEVLRLVAEGLTNRQIAQRLFITPKTAGLHVSHILAKLDVDTRVKAAAVAHRARLLNDSDVPSTMGVTPPTTGTT